MFLSPNIFGQSDMVLLDGMITMSGLWEVPTMIDMFDFLIYTVKVWVQLWVVLKKHKIIYKGIS